MVRFYEGDDFLCDSVAQFLEAGLEAGEALVVIATEAHRKAFTLRLEAKGFDIVGACDAGRFTLLDARSSLSLFMSGGMPDWDLFQRAIGSVLDRARGASARPHVRAYGEMVDLLWQEGNTAAALQLEEHWNELGKRHAFSLLCGYSMHNFRKEEQAQPFHAICKVHSQVIPTESYTRIEGEEARLREVSLLQQRARALEDEIERRKEVERALQEALKTRDDFLSVAGHELRTPLTALKLLLQSVQEMTKEGEDGRARERLGRAVHNIGRLSMLVDELLDVSRISAGRFELHPEELDLALLVREAVERDADAMARHECNVQLRVEEPVMGRWDRLRIEQVVVNLLSNAFKYGRGTPIEVTVKGTREGAQLIVRDHGIGISVEDQARIFNRFERAVSSQHFGGLGLGLWIVREILEAHGGTIRVESEPGKGAAFFVELPYGAGPRRAGA